MEKLKKFVWIDVALLLLLLIAMFVKASNPELNNVTEIIIGLFAISIVLTYCLIICLIKKIKK